MIREYKFPQLEKVIFGAGSVAVSQKRWNVSEKNGRLF